MRSSRIGTTGFLDTPMFRAQLRLITGDVTIFKDKDSFNIISFDKSNRQINKIFHNLDEAIRYLITILEEK